MTSISSSTLLQAYQSPRDRLQATLESQLSSGAIEQSDATALSTALDSIDETLKGQRQSGAGASKPPSPDEMQAKIDDLISAQVDSGALTSDQAEELSNVFAEAFANGPGGGQGPGGPGGGKGPGGPGGPGGPKGPPPGAESASGTDDTDGTDDDVAQLLQDFLKALQETQSAKEPKSYNASGDSTSTSTANAALLLDYQS